MEKRPKSRNEKKSPYQTATNKDQSFMEEISLNESKQIIPKHRRQPSRSDRNSARPRSLVDSHQTNSNTNLSQIESTPVISNNIENSNILIDQSYS